MAPSRLIKVSKQRTGVKWGWNGQMAIVRATHETVIIMKRKSCKSLSRECLKAYDNRDLKLRIQSSRNILIGIVGRWAENRSTLWDGRMLSCDDISASIWLKIASILTFSTPKIIPNLSFARFLLLRFIFPHRISTRQLRYMFYHIRKNSPARKSCMTFSNHLRIIVNSENYWYFL